jgi:cell division protein FtsN
MGVDPLTGVLIVLTAAMAMVISLIGGMLWASHREAQALSPEERQKIIAEYLASMKSKK